MKVHSIRRQNQDGDRTTHSAATLTNPFKYPHGLGNPFPSGVSRVATTRAWGGMDDRARLGALGLRAAPCGRSGPPAKPQHQAVARAIVAWGNYWQLLEEADRLRGVSDPPVS
jgi:hypothetical protein